MGVIGVLGAHPPFDEAVANGKSQAEVGLPFGVHMRGQLRQRVRQMSQELLPDGLGVEAINALLLQVFGPAGWGHAGAWLHHGIPLYILTYSPARLQPEVR